MKAIRIDYDSETDKIRQVDNQPQEDWAEVCERFDHDVQRIRTVTKRGDYTGLYACCDADNRQIYYLVKENARLKRLKHKVFLSKLGRPV